MCNLSIESGIKIKSLEYMSSWVYRPELMIAPGFIMKTRGLKRDLVVYQTVLNQWLGHLPTLIIVVVVTTHKAWMSFTKHSFHQDTAEEWLK